MSSPRRALHTAGLLLPLVLSHGLAAVDCNRNGIEDHLDVVQRRSDDCNANDVPDECDVRVVNLGYTLGSFMVPVRPMWLATGDLDGDGSIDIAAPCEPPGSVLLLWNQAPGFEDEVLVYPGTPVRLLETGDVDGDGRLDLVTATTDGIQVLINAGGRSLAPRELSGPPFEAGALALGDLNRDGDLDAVAAGPFHVAVLENVSGWTFEPVNRIVLGSGPIAVFIEDLEGDGDLDIVTGNSQGSVSAIFRRDDGTFAIPQNFSAGGLPSAAFASADLDRDSKADVAALSSRGEVTVAASIFDPCSRERARSPHSTWATWTVMGMSIWPLSRREDGFTSTGTPETVSWQARSGSSMRTFIRTERTSFSPTVMATGTSMPRPARARTTAVLRCSGTTVGGAFRELPSSGRAHPSMGSDAQTWTETPSATF